MTLQLFHKYFLIHIAAKHNRDRAMRVYVCSLIRVITLSAFRGSASLMTRNCFSQLMSQVVSLRLKNLKFRYHQVGARQILIFMYLR